MRSGIEQQSKGGVLASGPGGQNGISYHQAGVRRPERIVKAKSLQDLALSFSAEAENVTPMQCMMQAQTELAKWFSEHPGLRVARYKCDLDRGDVAKI